MTRAFLSQLQCQMVIPALILPLALGVYLLRKHRLIHRFIGFFTLKPVIATPIYIALIIIGSLLTQSSQTYFGAYLAIVPGLVLTVLIVRRYKLFFTGEYRKVAITLLVMDLLRWGSAILLITFLYEVFCVGRNCAEQIASWVGIGVLFVALLMPSLYTGVAYLLYQKTKSNANNPPEDEGT